MTDVDQMTAFDTRRLQALAAQSAETDTVHIECVYWGQVVQFTISSLEMQHLVGETLWSRYVVPAWEALHLPRQVVADTPDERSQVVGVGNP